MGTDQGLIERSACEVVGLLQSGEVTPGDLLDALEARIGRVDGAVNACRRSVSSARGSRRTALMEKPADARGLLAGLPVPIKDLTEVAGVRTTFGSPIFKDNVPAQSEIMVEMLEREGALIYAKSNTPEFGAGANTFNEVFGATRNPWNTARSAAGSSGGAAVALATGMAWLAQGLRPRRLAPGTRRASAALSACGRARAGSRPTPGFKLEKPALQSKGRWRAQWRMSPSCSTPCAENTRATRCPCPMTAARSSPRRASGARSRRSRVQPGPRHHAGRSRSGVDLRGRGAQVRGGGRHRRGGQPRLSPPPMTPSR